MAKGYRKYCSSKCSIKDPEYQEKIRQTNLRKYGVENPAKSDKVKEKQKRTFKEKYGVDNPLKNDSVREKVLNTNRERYGISYPMQSDKIKEKREHTYLKNGYQHPMYNENIKNKVRQTNLKRYGVEHSLQNEEIKDKFRETVIERYGVEHPLQNEEIKTKVKETNLEKYGVGYPLQSDEIKNKYKQTNLKKYGVENVSQDIKVKKKKNKKSLKRLHEVFDKLNIKLLDREYNGSFFEHIWLCKSCGNVFSKKWDKIKLGYSCPFCTSDKKLQSNQEQEVYEFLKNKNLNVIRNSRQIIPPKELDLYLPDYNLAIEFNGLYWHSELINSDPYYHLNKTKECEKRGIKLIHIFEDEWLYNNEDTKLKLLQFIHLDEEDFYKKSYIIEFKKDEQQIILIKFDYKNITSTIRFSILQNNEFFLKSFYNNSYYVYYELKNLLNFFISNYSWNKIYVDIDNRFPFHNIYKKLGFLFKYRTSPNFYYIYNTVRYNYSKLYKYYPKIWDCGNSRFELINNIIENK